MGLKVICGGFCYSGNQCIWHCGSRCICGCISCSAHTPRIAHIAVAISQVRFTSHSGDFTSPVSTRQFRPGAHQCRGGQRAAAHRHPAAARRNCQYGQNSQGRREEGLERPRRRASSLRRRNGHLLGLGELLARAERREGSRHGDALLPLLPKGGRGEGC